MDSDKKQTSDTVSSGNAKYIWPPPPKPETVVNINIENIVIHEDSCDCYAHLDLSEEVAAFAEEMQGRINDDAIPPPFDAKDIHAKLSKKLGELLFALQYHFSPESIRETAADIGVYAMAIADHEGELLG